VLPSASKVAYELSSDHALPKVSTIDVLEGENGSKIPSRLLYNAIDGKGIAYGDEITTNLIPDAIEGFKLLLLDREDVPLNIATSPFYLRAQQLADAHEKKSYTIAADYLSLLWQWAMSEVEKEVSLGKCPIYIVLTVPGNWTDYAIARTRKAAELAGIAKNWKGHRIHLSLRTEPETAALAMLKTKALCGMENPNAGDVAMIVDLGELTIAGY
jgi:hypothetical protein